VCLWKFLRLSCSLLLEDTLREFSISYITGYNFLYISNVLDFTWFLTIDSVDSFHTRPLEDFFEIHRDAEKCWESLAHHLKNQIMLHF
jgi:hypothetical protein